MPLTLKDVFLWYGFSDEKKNLFEAIKQGL